MRQSALRALLPLLAALLLPACGAGGAAPPDNKVAHAASSGTAAPDAAPDPYSVPGGESADPANPLDKGWFRFSSVVDGDTIWVLPLQQSLRLLCIDSEETIKAADDRTAAGMDLIDWPATVAFAHEHGFQQSKLVLKPGVDAAQARKRWADYTKAQRAGKDRPVKYGTPYGELATEYAKWFFAQAAQWSAVEQHNLMVRLEIDDPKRQVDIYGRYLVYTFVKGPDGNQLNFHVEQVRAGMSPYFPKYGHSVLYRQEFEQAQAEARAAKRGIWSDDWGMYPDYEERLAWWGERGENLSHFAQQYGDNADYFELGAPAELVRLRERIGQEVVVYGLIESVRGRSDPPTVTFATGSDAIKFPVSTSSVLAIQTSDSGFGEKYVYARGTVIDRNGTLGMETGETGDIWVEPAWLAELYRTGKSKDFGEKEMASDVPGGTPAAQPVKAEPPKSEKPISTDKATGLKIIPWERAREFENQGEFIVEGVVHSGRIAGKVAFLNFHADFRNTFGIFIPPTSLSGYLSKFDGFPDSLIGKTIRARGTITHYDQNGQDKPQIIVQSTDQVWIVE